MEEVQGVVEDYLCLICKSLGRFEEKGDVTQEEIYNKFMEVTRVAFGAVIREDDFVTRGYLYELYKRLLTNFFEEHPDKIISREVIREKAIDLIGASKASLETFYSKQQLI